jgi:hypothetical protein
MRRLCADEHAVDNRLERAPDAVEVGRSPETTALPGQTAGRSQAATTTMVLPRTLALYMA